MTMEDHEFTSDSPGKLEPTSFNEHFYDEARQVFDARTVKGSAFVPDPLPPSLDVPAVLVDLYPDIIQAERAISFLAGAVRQGHLRSQHLLQDTFKRLEALQSSAIEDTHSSPEDLALLKHAPQAVQDQPTTREVDNYVQAMDFGFSDERPICINQIKDMHRILLRGTRHGANPGEFRRTQNVIGGGGRLKLARFVPPPPARVDRLMAQFEKFLHQEDSPFPRLVRFAMLHYQFETIHPFNDGNGRLGRLLVTLMLCKQGQLHSPFVYFSGYFERHRQEYYDLLHAVSTRGEWGPWLGFFIRGVAEQAREGAQRAERLIELREQIMRRMASPRASAYLPKLIDSLFADPAVTASSMEATLGCSRQTAANLIEGLVERGVLKQKGDRDRNRVYLAPAILDLMRP